MTRRTGLSRRDLIAKFGLSLGLVPLLSDDRARAADPARRVLIVQWTNGVLTGPWWPSGSESGFNLSTCLEPLAPFKNDVLILRGLNLQACKSDPLAGAGHQSLPHLLTGARGAETNITGGDGGSKVIGNSISIDQHIANDFARRKLTTLPSLELAVQRDAGRPTHSFMSFKGKAKDKSYPDALTPNENPYDVFKRFFQGSALGKDALEKLKARRQLVLDVVNPELKALRQYLGQDDKRLLDEHIASVEALNKELNNLGAAADPSKPSCSQPVITAGVTPSDRTQFHTLTKMQLELAVAAFRCDITRVATLMLSNSSNTGNTFTFLGDEFKQAPDEDSGVSSGSTIGHHEIAHAAGDGNSSLKVKIDKWYVEQFAHVLKRLKETPDPYETGKTLLDNSVAVLANHMGNGASHGVDNTPFILGGRAGGYYKTGRYINFNGIAHNGLLASLGRAMGVPTDRFGDHDTTAQIDTKLRG